MIYFRNILLGEYRISNSVVEFDSKRDKRYKVL